MGLIMKQVVCCKNEKRGRQILKTKSTTKSSPHTAWIFFKHIAGIDKADSTQINMRIMGIKSRERGDGCCSR